MDTVANARDMGPSLTIRSVEIERERQLPADLLDGLVAAGFFRMLTAAEHGGDDLPLPDVLRVVAELAAGDGAVGWLVGQGAVAQLMVRHLPRRTVDALYADGPDLLGAGAVAPKGRAAVDGDGWRVTGQWPFASGCRHAQWFYLHCLVVDGVTPRIRPDGGPETRLVLLPAAEVQVLDTWHVAGLRGSGSHDVRVVRQLCPAERSCSFDQPQSVPGPLALLPSRDLGGLFVAAAALGIATGALRELVELAAGGKRPAFSTRRLADGEVFQDRLGTAEMELRAAGAVLASEVDQAWRRADAGRSAALLDRARLRATGPHVVSAATRVVDTAYALGGGTAIYDGSPLQRRMRDAHTATQHFAAGRDFTRALGAVLVDADPDSMLR